MRSFCLKYIFLEKLQAQWCIFWKITFSPEAKQKLSKNLKSKKKKGFFPTRSSLPLSKTWSDFVFKCIKLSKTETKDLSETTIKE